MWTRLEQGKYMENIAASEYIMVDEATQLWELFIIKLKFGICVLETNFNRFSQENKHHVDLNTETNGDDIRE